MYKKISIVRGPSAEELFFSLRLNQEVRETRFVVVINNVEKSIPTSVTMIRTEGNHLWSCELYFQPGKDTYLRDSFGTKKGLIYPILYSTKTRRGILLENEMGMKKARKIQDLLIRHNSISRVAKLLKVSEKKLHEKFGELLSD